MIRFGKRDAKTKHTYFEERLSAYLDDELLPQEQAAVEEHVATCEACQWDLDTLRQTVQWTRELPTLTVPRVFTVPAPAEHERAARRRWRLVPVMQGATALIALLLFFVVAGDFLLPGRSRQASAPEPMMMQATMPVEVEAEAPEAEVAVEEAVTVVETVVVEVEVAVEAQKVVVEPTEAPLAAAATPAEPTPLPTGIEGARAEMEEPAAAPPAAEAPLLAAPAPDEMETLDAVGGGAVTPTLAATLSAGVTSTDRAEATELAFAPQDEGEVAATGTWGGREINWLRVAEYVLGVAFVAFSAGTVVVMLLQRRVL
ncbi:MAG: zf-HC2 domain-containing protein [Anaerolineae bacterium]